MSSMGSTQSGTDGLILPDLMSLAVAALGQVQKVVSAAREAIGTLIAPNGRLDGDLLNQHQFAAHAFAWYASYGCALEQIHDWAVRLEAAGKLGTLERAILQSAFGEYLAQMAGGIPLNQGEIARPADIRVPPDLVAQLQAGAVGTLVRAGATTSLRVHIAELVSGSSGRQQFGDADCGDDLQMLADEVRRFVEREVVPQAHRWHLANDLIPPAVVGQLAEMGVFGITIGEEYGGLNLSKLAMCVVTEELSRGYIGVGSLGTRAEIAAELIARSGTAEQREFWLPRIARGGVLPTAVFTEPNTGSDLGALTTRAVRQSDGYHVTGSKTWITHAARADLMIILARTNATTRDYSGLSILLAPKQKEHSGNPFPDAGIQGTEISVLGYRGMREYELGFDDFVVPGEGLLGEEEGHGFKQLMSTFESARIQTAARAVGVAQNALELGLQYALSRKQFRVPLIRFPRIAGKLGWMVVETMIARQATYYAAREKDRGHRCDVEAGMAKLLAARVAWSNADNALQIHGGNGYALEYEISRVLCDSRVLNIFEGTAEIQAEVIARGLVGRDRPRQV
jgi:(2S)-methylsuccinyl-CoA dehydrogenase